MLDKLKKFMFNRPISTILLLVISASIAFIGLQSFSDSPAGPPPVRQGAKEKTGNDPAQQVRDYSKPNLPGQKPETNSKPEEMPSGDGANVQESKSDVLEAPQSDLPIIGTETRSKVVALTFDHSWGNTFTPRILDTLKKHNLKVTFFLMGPWSENHPKVARRIAMDGHEIASHGYRHENYGEKSQEWIIEDLTKSHAQITKATGIEPKLFRPPNGHYSKQSLKLVSEFGYKTILWNVDSLDWTNPGRDAIIDRVMKRVKPGAIILMHASDTPVQTADALPILLEQLAAQGYKIVTVSELLTQYSEKGILRDGE